MDSDVRWTRRGFIAITAALAVGPSASVHADYPHPAVPARLLDRQLDTAVAEAVFDAPRAARAATRAIATRAFGPGQRPMGPVVVPGPVRAAVRAVVRRG